MKKKFIIFMAVFLLAFASIALPVIAEPTINISAFSCCLIDYNTGKILYAKNENERHQIASMVKLMTTLLTFEEIEAGNLSETEKIVVSSNASGMGGSQMFLDANTEYVVSDLIKGMVVCSANDASVALSEKICGTTEVFVAKMNAKAKLLGLQNTLFCNCTGLPSGEQYSTARDVSLITKELLKHSGYYKYSKIWMEDFTHPSGRITGLTNTNKLIKHYANCDSGKTGFTNEAKFCLSASGKKDNFRAIATVIGAPSSKERFNDVKSLLNYGFACYKGEIVFNKNKELDETLQVKKGKTDKLPIMCKEDLILTMPKNIKANIKI
ncbi:MAG: D-alanyl-D-alanine carboxypeptidase family protein, partial [Clostridia bacterium]